MPTLIPRSRYVSKLVPGQTFSRRHCGAANVCSLIELLLLGLFVCGVVLLVPQMLSSLNVSSVDQPPRKIQPIFRLTRTTNERLWVQVGYQEIDSVDFLTQDRQTEFRTHGPPIAGSRISRDGTTFMVSLAHQEIQIRRNSQIVISFPVPPGETNAAYTSTRSSTRDRLDDSEPTTPRASTGSARSGDTVHMSMSASGTTAIVALAGKRIRCWDLSDSHPRWTDYEIPQPVVRIALNPTGKLFVASTEQGELNLYQATTGVRVKSLADVGPIKSDLVFSDDGNWLAFAASQTMNLYDAQTLNIAWRVPLSHASDEQHVAISHNGGLVAAANSHVGIEVLRGSRGETVCKFTPDSAPRSLDFCASGDTLFSTLSDGSIRIWSLPDDANGVR